MRQEGEGLRLLAAALARVAQEHDVARRDPHILDVYDAWLLCMERGEELAESTLGVCRQARARLEPLLGSAKASSMTPGLVEDLMGALLDSGLRLSTARARLGKLRSAWRWAHGRGMVAAPWPDAARRRRRRNVSTPKRALDVLELAHVLEELRAPYRLPAQVLAETGCRPGELVGADCRDLLPGDLLRLVTGKGGGADRVVPLRPATAEALRALSRGRSGPLLTGERDGRRLQTRTLAKHVVAAMADLRRRIGPETVGASYDLDTYSLRRSLIDHAAAAGVDEVVTRALVGHSQRGTHHRYRRGSVTRDQLREAVDRVALWRSSEFRRKSNAARLVTSRKWTPEPAPQSLLRACGLELPRAESLPRLGAATRTWPPETAQAVAFLNARLAVSRAAVRAPGCRGLLLHARPEVYAVT